MNRQETLLESLRLQADRIANRALLMQPLAEAFMPRM